MIISSSLELPNALLDRLSPWSASLLSLIFTTSYVGSIYISQRLFASSPKSSSARHDASSSQNGKAPSEPIMAEKVGDTGSGQNGRYAGASSPDPLHRPPSPRPGSRNHPDIMKLRMKAVALATALNLLGVYGTVKSLGRFPSEEAIGPTLSLLALLPYSAAGGLTVSLGYLLAPILFLGPLYAEYLDDSLPLSPVSWIRCVHDRVREGRILSLVELRNYVVGPVTEELTFRSTILSVSLLSHMSPAKMVFATPLWFGIAHAHHALEVYREGEGPGGWTSQRAKLAILGSAFQLTYTTLFGWFTSYLFLRTGSVIPPVVAHVFCNMMGIYLPTTAIVRHRSFKTSIITAYLIGIIGFIYGIRYL